MHSIILSGLVLVAIGAATPQTRPDHFEIELRDLHALDMRQIGRAALAAAYEKFVANHEEDARVVDVMTNLANIYENDGSPTGRAKGVEWYRAALAKATEGSDAWIKIQLQLSHRVPGLNERLGFLDTVATRAKDDRCVMARVECARVVEYVHASKVDDAEKPFFALMDCLKDPKNVPKKPLDQWEIKSEQTAACVEMLSGWASAPWPKDERLRKITEFRDKYLPRRGPLFERANETLEQIKAGP